MIRQIQKMKHPVRSVLSFTYFCVNLLAPIVSPNTAKVQAWIRQTTSNCDNATPAASRINYQRAAQECFPGDDGGHKRSSEEPVGGPPSKKKILHWEKTTTETASPNLDAIPSLLSATADSVKVLIALQEALIY